MQRESSVRCEKRHFLRHLYIKCIFLPRQARDKHRETSKKSGISLAFCPPRLRPVRQQGQQGQRDSGGALDAERERPGEKTALFVHFLYSLQMIILPRQARDKHRGNSKTSTVFSQLRSAAPGVTADPQCATAPKKGSTGVVTLAKCVTPASPAQQWKYDSSTEQLTTAQDGA